MMPSLVDLNKMPRLPPANRTRQRRQPRSVPYSYVIPSVPIEETKEQVIQTKITIRPVIVGSQINPEFPVYGNPTTQSVRDNFMHAKAEIEALQASQGSGINTDAPADGKAYGRQSSQWSQVIAASGDVVDGGNF